MRLSKRQHWLAKGSTAVVGTSHVLGIQKADSTLYFNNHVKLVVASFMYAQLHDVKQRHRCSTVRMTHEHSPGVYSNDLEAAQQCHSKGPPILSRSHRRHWQHPLWIDGFHPIYNNIAVTHTLHPVRVRNFSCQWSNVLPPINYLRPSLLHPSS